MAVRTEDINKATAEVTGSFDDVEQVIEQQKKGIVYGKSLLFRLLPGICRALSTMGYATYPKKTLF